MTVPMNRFNYCLLWAVLFLLPAWVQAASAWEGVVVKVLDGDSMLIKRDGRIHEIRLYGIDAPEYRQSHSSKAKQFVKRLVLRQPVAVEKMDVDRYGRIVALVFVQDKLVNRELVRAGLAWYYPRYCRRQPLCGELADMEEEARKQRRGLWRDPDPVSPWEWKRRERLSGSQPRGGWILRLPDRWYVFRAGVGSGGA